MIPLHVKLIFLILWMINVYFGMFNITFKVNKISDPIKAMNALDGKFYFSVLYDICLFTKRTLST